MTLTDQKIQAFIQLYKDLGPGSVSRQRLSEVYSQDVIFSDPVHCISGLESLTHYFSGLYENITKIRFEFHNVLGNSSEASLHWTMTYRHPKLYGGKQDIAVEGVSLLAWEGDHIVSHQDIFDAGSLLYEHLPVIGWIIRKLKERMA